MTRHGKSILGTAFMMAVVFLLSACLNPIGFSPDNLPTLKIEGEIDVYNTNNAVAWVINKTKSVDVRQLTITVAEGPQPDNPLPVILNRPTKGTSHASYLKPSPDKISQPYRYRFSIETDSSKPEEKFFQLEKYLPRAQDYAIFLIRKADGTLDLVDEEPPMSALDPDDTTNPPLPPDVNTGRYPLIVRNVTKSADVLEVTFKDVPYFQEVIANVNDQKQFYMPPAEYGPTYIRYKINRTGDENTTYYRGESPRVEIINPTVTDAQSWHLLFLYFYKSKSGEYKITQQWPPIPDDSDAEDTITANYTDTRVRVLNKVGLTEVTDIAITKDRATFYSVNSDDFSPEGVITGGGFDWNAHSKSAIFEPGQVTGIGPFVGEPYEVWIKLTDKRQNGRQGEIYIKRTGVNLWLGNTYNIIISKDDVKEGEDVIIIPPQPQIITYSVTSNGGPPALNTEAAYTTTTVTVTFSEPVPGAQLVRVSDTAGIGAITFTKTGAPDGKVWEATVSPTTSGSLTIKVDNAVALNVDSADRSVPIYKQSEPLPPPLPPAVAKIMVWGANEEWSVYFGADPSTLTFTKNKVNAIGGVFLPPGFNNASVTTLAQLAVSPLRPAAQAAADYVIIDIIGSGATIVNSKTGAILGTGTHWERNGNWAGQFVNDETWAIKTANSTGSFQLKATIPANRNNGTEVSRTFTVNYK